MYKLILTEKPSVAKSIAVVLKANEHKDGFFIGNGYIVLNIDLVHFNIQLDCCSYKQEKTA